MSRINGVAEGLAGAVFFSAAVGGVACKLYVREQPLLWIGLAACCAVSFVIFVYSKRLSEGLAWTCAVGLIYLILFSGQMLISGIARD